MGFASNGQELSNGRVALEKAFLCLILTRKKISYVYRISLRSQVEVFLRAVIPFIYFHTLNPCLTSA